MNAVIVRHRAMWYKCKHKSAIPYSRGWQLPWASCWACSSICTLKQCSKDQSLWRSYIQPTWQW